MPELPDGTFRSQAEFNFIATLPDGTKVWVLSASGPTGEVHLPRGRLSVPVGQHASPLPATEHASPGRTNLMIVDGLLSYVDSSGNVVPVDTPGVQQFLQLLDTPGSYAGAGLQVVRVNLAENALEFSPAGVGALAAHHSYPARASHLLAGPGPFDSTLVHWPGWTIVDTRKDGNQIGANFPGFNRETDSGTGRRVAYVDYDQSIEENLQWIVNLYRGVPGNFTTWQTGITLWHRLLISGTPGGTEFTQLNMEVFDPTNAADVVVASAQRTVNTVAGSDPAYVPLTIPAAALNAAGFAPGDMVRLRMYSASGNFFGGFCNYHCSLLTTDWG